MKKLALVAVVLGCAMAAPPASGQATRTWVSGVGDDANPCSRTAPCKTFAGAISKTFIGGEIDALDDGGFGTLTITKSITIDGGGHEAGILASGTNGINVSIAPSSDDPNRTVVLRGLTINGTGANGTIGTNTGLRGINVLNNGAVSLRLENVRIANFAQHGIDLRPSAAAPADVDATLDGVVVSNVFGNALEVVAPDTGHRINVMVRNSTLEGAQGTNGDPAGETGIGLLADTGAHIWLTGTTIFDNAIGIKTLGRNGGGGVVDSFCDNQIGGNVDNGQAPNLLCPQPAPAPPPPPSPPVTMTKEVPAPERCAVADLHGLTVAIARRMLSATNCSLGTVKRKRTTRRTQIGKVIAQSAKKGAKLAKGAKVGITIGRR